MKYIKGYNEAKAFDSEHDITLIKEIILELKHEYPSIDGEISTHESGGSVYTVIRIKPMLIYNKASNKIDNIEKRMKYFNDVVSCSKRLQDALNVEVRIQNLFDNLYDDGGTINIWIDDIKNVGKKWQGT